MHPLIGLWTHPRSRSTALERAMMERGDLHIVHEPFSYAYYVEQKPEKATHLQVDPDQPRSYPEIRDALLREAESRPVLFKDMAYHALDPLLEDTDFLRRMRHAFLVRDPAESIASYYALDPSCSLEEMGVEQLCRLRRRVREVTDQTGHVVRASSLVESPESTLAGLCRAVGLEPVSGVASWEAGHQKEWDSWKEWHKDAAQSSGIRATSRRYEHTVQNHGVLKRYYEHHLPFYREILDSPER